MDTLWLLHGIIFYILIFTTGQWMRLMGYFITVFIAARAAMITGLGMSPALSTKFKWISSVFSIQVARSLPSWCCAEQITQHFSAYEMNNEPLSFGHGAPLRLRNEVRLGFKMVKWIKGIEFIEDFPDIGGGLGGYNNDHELFGYRQSI